MLASKMFDEFAFDWYSTFLKFKRTQYLLEKENIQIFFNPFKNKH